MDQLQLQPTAEMMYRRIKPFIDREYGIGEWIAVGPSGIVDHDSDRQRLCSRLNVIGAEIDNCVIVQAESPKPDCGYAFPIA